MKVQLYTTLDKKQAQVRATVSGARIRIVPSSPQINRMCVRRLCYHGGLLEIEPRMHTVEAGLLLRCCMSFNSVVSAVHLLQAVELHIYLQLAVSSRSHCN